MARDCQTSMVNSTQQTGQAESGHRPIRVIAGVAVVTALAWSYLGLVASAGMSAGWALGMPMTARWSVPKALMMVLMWAVMMAAMMLPSAVPMIAAYARSVKDATDRQFGSVAVFAGGYLMIWGLFAVAATAAQWVAHDRAVVNGMGALLDPRIGAVALIGAGVYQLTPVKQLMLRACRTPLGFLASEWRDGRMGALWMGMTHGKSCLGCCWALMLLLFVLGVMNLLWVFVLASFIALEKLTRSGFVPRLGAAVLIIAGVTVLVVSAVD